MGVALDTLAILCQEGDEVLPRDSVAAAAVWRDSVDGVVAEEGATEARVDSSSTGGSRSAESGTILRRAAKLSMVRVQASMGPVAWRHTWDAAAVRLDELVLELRHAARPGCSEATVTDRLKLLAGLLDLLNSSSSSSQSLRDGDTGVVLPLPLADILSAMALLVHPEDDKAAMTSGGRNGAGAAAAVLTVSTLGCGAREATVGYFRRPRKFLRSVEAASAARRALRVLGCVATQRSNLASLIEDASLEMASLDAAATGVKEGDNEDEESFDFGFVNHLGATDDLQSDVAWETLSAPVAEKEVRRPRHPSEAAAERRAAGAARLRGCAQAAAFSAAMCEVLYGAASSLAACDSVVDSEAPEVEACRCFALEMLQGSLWAGVQHEKEEDADEANAGAGSLDVPPQRDLMSKRKLL